MAARLRHHLARFFAIETAGGVVLVVATVVALVWASSPWQESYRSLFDEDVRHWVNDGLMAAFFFVVGVELRWELVAGRLSRRADAAFPIAAAVGGMVVPAGLFALVNLGGDGIGGWGIPMATDIAFVLGVMTLAGSRVPPELRVALLGLAVVDDIGSVLVIALFYGGGLHPTLVAVGLGLLVPVRWSERVLDRLHPLSSFVVVPVFALANVGIGLSGPALADAAGSWVTWGVVLGLVVGKPLGIVGATALATRLGVADRPAGVSTRQVLGLGVVAGVGFTVSLFLADLAYDQRALVAEAKLGVLAASVLAGIGGVLLLRQRT